MTAVDLLERVRYWANGALPTNPEFAEAEAGIKLAEIVEMIAASKTYRDAQTAAWSAAQHGINRPNFLQRLR